MSQSLKNIQKILKDNANASTLSSHEKFFPGIPKAYGVAMPILNKLAREWKDGSFELVIELGTSTYLEEKILAAKLLNRKARKDPEKALLVFVVLAEHIDNWAVCDTLGMQGLKPLVKTHGPQIFDMATQYNHSQNPWLRRLSLVMVEWYTREKKQHPAIRRLAANLRNDNEYYVKKAVAWIDKNFSKGK